MAFSPPFQRPFSATFDRRAAAAGPTVLFYDTFTDSDGVQLQNHTPNVGGAWMANASWTISSNRAVNSDYLQLATADAGASDYVLSFVVQLKTDTSILPRGVLVRYAWTNDFYHVGLKCGSNRFGIYNYLNTAIADTAFTVALNTDYAVVVTCNGSTITATVNGGNEVSYASAATGRSTIGLRIRYAADQIDDLRVVAL